jgi:hypothetical protein
MSAAEFGSLNPETPDIRGFGILGVRKTVEVGCLAARERTPAIGHSREFSPLDSRARRVAGPAGGGARNRGLDPRCRARGSGPGGEFSALNFETPGNRGFVHLGIGAGAGEAFSGPGRWIVRRRTAQKFSALNPSESVRPGRGEMPYQTN